LPKYLKNCDLKGVYAMYSSGIILPLIGSFAAYVPPESPHAYAYTLFDRAAGPYTLLVLAQCIGMYHVAKLLCHWLPAKIKPEYVTYAIVLVIVMFSFYMKPGGGSILFQAFE
jgi:hypothetical protein